MPGMMVDSWQAKRNPPYTSAPISTPSSCKDTTPGCQQSCIPPSPEPLSRQVSGDASERSFKERQSLERLLQEEGALRLHHLPALPSFWDPLHRNDTAGEGPLLRQAAADATSTIPGAPFSCAASWGPPATSRQEAAIEEQEGARLGASRGNLEGDTEDSMRGEAPPHELGRERSLSLTEELSSSWEERTERQADEGEEALLNSISLSQLYLGDRFASGTFGRLYTGIFQGQDVAIKILRSPASEEAATQMSSLFRQEVTMLSQLRHPNIVQFHGACQKPPLHCLVTELLPGGTVHKYLTSLREPPPVDVALRMALDVASGMEYLHAKNIIHRDLKSDNLVLSKYHVVKLTDFGSARVAVEQGAQMTAETGTFKFMAPEMIRRRVYSRKVDVYSFGILLWELLTGESAFAGMSGVQAAFAVVNRGLRPEVPPALPPLLRNLLRSCWHHNPDRRPDFFAIVRLLKQLRQNHLSGSVSPPRSRRSTFGLAACFGRGGTWQAPEESDSSESSTSVRRIESCKKLHIIRERA